LLTNMSLCMHIVVSVPPLEVVERLKNNFPPNVIAPLKRCRLGWNGEWRFGKILVQDLSPDMQEELRLESTLRDPRTLIWFSCDIRDAGEDALYEIAASILREWREDVAVMPDGGEPALTRVGGHLTLHKERLNVAHLAMFR
jgi:hypothetical protein